MNTADPQKLNYPPKVYQGVALVLVCILGIFIGKFFSSNAPLERAGSPTQAYAQEKTTYAGIPNGIYRTAPIAHTASRNNTSIPSDITLHPISESSKMLNAEGTDIEQDLQILGNVLGVYKSAHGSFPTGLNLEVTQSLLGNNTRGLALLQENHHAVNNDQELTDRWGTPFFFHNESSHAINITSAGPDKIFWTADDVSLTDNSGF